MSQLLAPGNQQIYIPLIDLPEARGSEIVFNSRSPQTMNVTPVFYTRNGEVVIADPIQVNSAEIRYVDIKSLLPERYRKQRDWGGFALTYYGTNREMWSQFRFLGVLLEPRKLKPHETAVFDLRDFRNGQKTDSTGNRLPSDVSLGQFKWTVKGITNGKLLLVGRAEMVSRSERVSSSYSCNDPCPPFLQGDLNPFPPPVVFVSGTATSSACETAIYNSGYSYTWAASANWSADNSAVSINPSDAHTTNVTGEQPGDSCITADMGREESYGWDGLNCYDNNNSYAVAGEGCLAMATLQASVVSPTVTGDGDAVTAGERFTVRAEVRLADGSRASTDGDASLSVEGTTGNDETIPGGITIVNGAGSSDVTLLRVPNIG